MESTPPGRRARPRRGCRPVCAAGAKVDLVLEAPDGSIVGIEIKASADFGERDLRGLRALAEVAGAQLRRGILLHTGRVVETLGPRLVAAPITTLWQ